MCSQKETAKKKTHYFIFFLQVMISLTSHQSNAAYEFLTEWHTRPDRHGVLGEIFLGYTGKHRFYVLDVGMISFFTDTKHISI